MAYWWRFYDVIVVSSQRRITCSSDGYVLVIGGDWEIEDGDGAKMKTVRC